MQRALLGEEGGALRLITKRKETSNKVLLKFYLVPVGQQGSLHCLQLAVQQSDSRKWRPNGATHLDHAFTDQSARGRYNGGRSPGRPDVTADLPAVLTEEGSDFHPFSTLTLELLLNTARPQAKRTALCADPENDGAPGSRASLSDPTSGAHGRQLFPVKSCRIQ